MKAHTSDFTATIVRVFGKAPIQCGEIVSAQHHDHYTVATKYDGNKVFGMSLNDVITVDIRTYILRDESVSDGSIFNVITRGLITLPRKTKWKIGTLLTISKKGKLRAARHDSKKIYGLVIQVDDDFCVIDFNSWGLKCHL